MARPFSVPPKVEHSDLNGIKDGVRGRLDVIGMLSAQDAHLLFRVVQVILTAPKQRDFLHREEGAGARITLKAGDHFLQINISVYEPPGCEAAADGRWCRVNVK